MTYMATSKALKVVSTVRRAGDAPKAPAFVPKKKNTAAKAAARASRKAAVAPLLHGRTYSKLEPAPVIIRETPHVLKRDANKPLIQRLNDKLLLQLATRKVTNEAAAEALGVHPTYLSRTLTAMGETKVKGKTSAHREARSKLAHTREQYRAQLAKKVNRGELTITAASKQAKCTERTMFRWCAKYENVR